MKRLLLGILIGAACLFFYQKWNAKSTTEIKSTQLIEQQLKNVSKLIVTEGYFSDIITYKDAKSYYLSWLTAEKKAVVLVKAKATISYDLKSVIFETNNKTQQIIITKIPDPEIQLNPKLEYYDVQQDFLNSFEASDYNKISNLVEKRLLAQIENSTFKTNAKNRFVSEFYSFIQKTELKGWSVVLEGGDNLNTYTKETF